MIFGVKAGIFLPPILMVPISNVNSCRGIKTLPLLAEFAQIGIARTGIGGSGRRDNNHRRIGLVITMLECPIELARQIVTRHQR